MTDISLPEGLTDIEAGAFINCSALESITFPSTLSLIGEGAFAQCESMTSIVFTGSAPTIGELAFNGIEAEVKWPVDDSTWEDVAVKPYGGSLTWLSWKDPDSESTESEPTVTAPIETTDAHIHATEKTDTIVLTDTLLTPELLESACDENVTLALDHGEYRWSIPGGQIADTDLNQIDMGVSLNTQSIPEDILSTIAENRPILQLSLAHSGDFGFTAKLTINVGKAYTGMNGKLYYYNGFQLEPMNTAVIDSDGSICLSFSHASDYVIVIEKPPVFLAHVFKWILAVIIFTASAAIFVLAVTKRRKKIR